MQRTSRSTTSKGAKARSGGGKGGYEGNGTVQSSNGDGTATVAGKHATFASANSDADSWQNPDTGDEEEGEHGEDGHKGRGCRCGRTKCLKQYCQCFRNDVRCTPECLCSNCHNDGNHEEIRMSAVRHIRMNNPEAFKGTSLEVVKQEVQTPRGSVHTVRGCRCRRSKCQKKYCECYSAGLACTENCVCNDCENGNVASSPSRAQANRREGVDDEQATDGAGQWPGVEKQEPGAYTFPSLVSGFEAGQMPFYQQGYENKSQGRADRSVAAGTKRSRQEMSDLQGPVFNGGDTAGSRQAPVNPRPPLPSATNTVNEAQSTSGKMSTRKKPVMSVQVPVAPISKGAVIPLSDPSAPAASAPTEYQRQNSNTLLPSASQQPQASPAANFDFSAKNLEFDSSLLFSADGTMQRSISDVLGGGAGGGSGWTPRSSNIAPSPRAFPSAQYPGWSPREGLRSSARRNQPWNQPCPPPWATSVPPTANGSGGGGGGMGLLSLAGEEPAPSPCTRSRSGLALHRNTPPTSPATWVDPLADPYQDPDDIIPEPLSGRAWFHKDLN